MRATVQGKKGRPGVSNWLVYGMLYLFQQTCVRIGWWRWRVEGVENLPPRQVGGMIVAMNHVSWLDIFAVGALLPFSHRLSWLGKSELFSTPFSNWFFQMMNVVPVRRGKRDLTALHATAERIQHGAVMLIYPEGHRSRTGILQPGHTGLVRLAMMTGAPVVPAAIIGTQHGLRGTLRRREVVLRIGTPYRLAPTASGKIPSDLLAALTTEMMQRIAALLPPEYRGPYQLAPADAEAVTASE